MEPIIYERPREKIRNLGVATLTVVELLQLIIGTGTSKVSGAQLARQIEQLLHTGDITYETIARLPGMGEAKTCQVLAALEFAKRGLL